MRALLIGAVAALALAGCATTSTPQSSAMTVDDKGFAKLQTGSVYHVGTGLFCPDSYGDLPLIRTMEYQKAVDASCNYEDESSRVTVYAYASGGPLQDELERSVAAVLEASEDNELTLSQTLSEKCRDFGSSYNLQSQLLSGLSNILSDGGNEIQIDPSDEGGPVPYFVTALQGEGLNTFVAISQADRWRIKVRYTTLGVFDAEVEALQCAYLHDVVRTTVLSRGKADGAIEEADLQSLVDRLSEPKDER